MTLSGLNDYRHQVLIARLVTSINNHFNSKKKYNKYIATPETVVFREETKKIPDLLIWNFKKGLHNDPEIAIEVCWSKDVETDIEKLTKLFETVKTLKEGFVFDFENIIAYRIFRKKDGSASRRVKSSKSDWIKLDLLKMK
tara:strand:+ start:6192 stop:6614 length:423 start_codon:yes stop_codon:yes gene_type:complete